jgi:hypothetical protein
MSCSAIWTDNRTQRNTGIASFSGSTTFNFSFTSEHGNSRLTMMQLYVLGKSKQRKLVRLKKLVKN